MNFNYFISEKAFQFIIDAVHLAATDGWKLLPYYRFEPGSGLWLYRGGLTPPTMSLEDVSYDAGTMAYPSRRRSAPEADFAAYLDRAKYVLDDASADLPEPVGTPDVSLDFEHLRWFPLPDELRIEA